MKTSCLQFLLAVALAFATTVACAADPLPSWNDGKGGKPVGINQHIGRRPIAAFGNSDGDLQMLQYAGAGSGTRFCLYVHHTDAEREYAYDRADSLAKLEKGLDEAKTKGWTVVDMKSDWRTIFPFGIH